MLNIEEKGNQAMSSRIVGIGSKQVEQLVSNKIQKREDREKAERSEVRTASGERVSLSEMARDVAAAKSKVELIPDVRTDRVEQLKAAIANGTYRVDGRAVAEKLLRETLLDMLL